MTFEIIPGIDVAAGRLARVTPEGAEPIDAFGGDPVAAAAAFASAGARRLHVVDVDAASGAEHDVGIISAVASVGVPVQASGGVSSLDEARACLDAGAARVVLGSAILADRDATAYAVASLGEAGVIGIEADDGVIRPRAVGSTELPLWATLEWLRELPVVRFLLTELGRVGGLGGADVEAVWALAAATGRPVLAAGGIVGIDDLRALAKLGGTVEGAVVGRALYEGLDLREAIAALG